MGILQGKTAVITGANRGIGRAVVEQFAKEEAKIWACARKYNSEFEPLKSGEDSLGQTYTTYYAHIPDFDSSYSLTVNGTEIVLQKP